MFGSHLRVILLMPFIGRSVDRWGRGAWLCGDWSLIGGGFVLYLDADIIGVPTGPGQLVNLLPEPGFARFKRRKRGSPPFGVTAW